MNDPQSTVLLDRIRSGDRQALGELFHQHHDRLWRMVYVRLDSRLPSRLDPDDILHEAFLDVARRIDEYLIDPTVPFYVWLRYITVQRMLMVQRVHLGAKMRAAGMEVSIPAPGASFASAESMAGQFVGHLTSPSEAAMRGELQSKLRAALAEMDPLDREVLALRHFEELGNNEVAVVLGISKEAASKRHVRALRRLREILADPTGKALL